MLTYKYINAKIKKNRKGEDFMLECKRCGSTQIVRSGMVRGKQRYLCKQCGCHFVEGDRRETNASIVSKSLCMVFHALGAGQCRTIGRYLRRDPSLIHRWMNKTPLKFQRQRNCVDEFWSIDSLFREIKQGDLENGTPMLLAHNVIDDLYIAVIVQRREKR